MSSEVRLIAVIDLEYGSEGAVGMGKLLESCPSYSGVRKENSEALRKGKKKGRSPLMAYGEERGRAPGIREGRDEGQEGGGRLQE